MIERDKLPEQETMVGFMEENDVQGVYYGLQLAERAYGGGVRAGIDALVHKPKEFDAAVAKYLRQPNRQVQMHTAIFGGGGLLFGALAAIDLINGSEDIFLTVFKAAIAVFGVLAALLERMKRAVMAKMIDSISAALDSTPASLNRERYSAFLHENPQLKAFAERLNQANELPTLRDLVALKFHEIDLLGAVSS